MTQKQTDKPEEDRPHVRPMDDPARGQGDKLEDKLPHGKAGETNRAPAAGERKPGTSGRG